MKKTQEASRSVFHTDRLQTKQLQNKNSFGTGEAALLGSVEFRKEKRNKCIYLYTGRLYAQEGTLRQI